MSRELDSTCQVFIKKILCGHRNCDFHARPLTPVPQLRVVHFFNIMDKDIRVLMTLSASRHASTDSFSNLACSMLTLLSFPGLYYNWMLARVENLFYQPKKKGRGDKCVDRLVG